MKNRFSKIVLSALLIVVMGITFLSGFAAAKEPKYVFYFIGDGLGAAQRQAAQYYLQSTTGNKNKKLSMNK